MKTKFSREGSKTQRKHKELGTQQISNVYMIFFVPSCLSGMFGFGLCGLG